LTTDIFPSSKAPLATHRKAESAGISPAASARRRLRRDQLAVLLLILVVWELAGRYLLDPLWISRPSLVAARLWSLTASGEIFLHMRRTLLAAFLGLALSFLVGVPIGVAMARYKYAHAVAEPFLIGIYSLPRIALGPLFIIWFGIDLFSKVMMAFSTVLFIFVLNVHQGLKTVEPDLLDLLKTMKAPHGYVTRKLLLPWILPWIISSLRLGIGLALIGAVVGEMLGSSAGLGWYIEHSAGQLDTTGVFSSLLILMLAAVAGDAVVALLEKRYLSWRQP
jgi:NitT/TauT family transport system permease protein